MTTVHINGSPHDVPEPARNLLSYIRYDLGLTGTKYGCGEGLCGACQRPRQRQAVEGLHDDCWRRRRRLFNDHRRPGDGWHAPSGAAGLRRRAGDAMRLLHPRLHHHRRRAFEPRQQSHTAPRPAKRWPRTCAIAGRISAFSAPSRRRPRPWQEARSDPGRHHQTRPKRSSARSPWASPHRRTRTVASPTTTPRRRLPRPPGFT